MVTCLPEPLKNKRPSQNSESAVWPVPFKMAFLPQWWHQRGYVVMGRKHWLGVCTVWLEQTFSESWSPYLHHKPSTNLHLCHVVGVVGVMPCLCRKCFAYYSVLPKAGVCLLNQEKVGWYLYTRQEGIQNNQKNFTSCRTYSERAYSEHDFTLISFVY